MNKEVRCAAIVDLIRHSPVPVSGSALAARFQVSRQVIVQDIALLRAAGQEIVSTNRGYILPRQQPAVRRVFKVCHDDAQTEDELSTIVDYGGTVLDVFVEHGIYGQFRAELNISSRRDVLKFMHRVENGTAALLKNVTLGEHFHTVEAAGCDILDEIETALREKRYLCGIVR